MPYTVKSHRGENEGLFPTEGHAVDYALHLALEFGNESFTVIDPYGVTVVTLKKSNRS